MNPLNTRHNGCTPTSSNCIIWQGPDIDYLALCDGTSITDVIYQLSTKFEEIQEIVNIDNYDITGLELGLCSPDTFEGLIQEIIQQLNEVKILNKTQGSVSEEQAKDLSKEQIEEFTIEKTTDIFSEKITGISIQTQQFGIEEYLNNLETCVSDIYTKYNEEEKRIKNAEESIEKLNDNYNSIIEKLTNLAYTFTSVLYDNVSIEDTQWIEKTDRLIKDYVDVIGTNASLKDSVSLQKVKGEDNALDTNTAKTMSDYNGWFDNPTLVSQSLSNIWLTIQDMRNYVNTIGDLLQIVFKIKLIAYRTNDNSVYYQIKVDGDESFNLISANICISDGEHKVYTDITDIYNSIKNSNYDQQAKSDGLQYDVNWTISVNLRLKNKITEKEYEYSDTLELYNILPEFTVMQIEDELENKITVKHNSSNILIKRIDEEGKEVTVYSLNNITHIPNSFVITDNKNLDYDKKYIYVVIVDNKEYGRQEVQMIRPSSSYVGNTIDLEAVTVNKEDNNKLYAGKYLSWYDRTQN